MTTALTMHGVIGAIAHRHSGLVAVSYDPQQVAPAMLVERLAEAGFHLRDVSIPPP